MKSNNESFRGRLITGGVLAMLAAVSSADGGHSVPAGMPAQHHLHLFEQVVVSPLWLLAAGCAALVLTVLVLRRPWIRAKT
jgi:hypothetical protein